MDERKATAHELNAMELALKDLETLYEQYFAGVDKREPIQPREALAKRLRRFANRRITQTDLRFRYQNLATRFHSYAGHWDRILRLIDEGRYVRHTANLATPQAAPMPAALSPADVLYRDLVAAHRACGSPGPLPDQRQIAVFLQRQEEKIREKFGERQVTFHVDIEDGKPKIKVREKKMRREEHGP